ncbi:ABC-F family ATP-binding cassette domain-containing protein [Corynebacterium amycolatum]|uniref:ABC-F family ATP-binding cassette domain-containing protein n=1 Tax=Corynebacterium TaxID=1716 RepID=UPI0008AA2102|nr:MULTISPECIES: ABC-F family ATP-binding cassette domain-containing protein [Corynebacterium]KAA9269502.1 ABC-F family ATP-binding cassette domain-containing protein [Corynebacterium amycolatum]MBU5624075.1 ATP-binding cassette domain-containing protein [Corynebacterium amycolatum]MCQ9128278.1 ABC-F family ATP-binding cassette domain-containing protein [Corynebacterium amycolatum]MCQ9142150.1 ABC-F family ATP-binding cassette domain-containing protein [Corynebacterium amycolatum]OHR33420.1 AB
MPEIFLDAISFSFGSRLILDRVSLHVSNGERVFLIGPNGVGKSTLLRILTGDLTPDSGRIISGAVPQYVPDPESFDGSVAQFLDSVLKPLNELLKRFEQATEAIAAGDNLRAVEFDELLARLNALDVWSLDARVNETLAGLGLGGFIGSGSNRMMQTLSPGQRARLKLAALLMVRPEVLILDEPTNHLDHEAADFLAGVVKNWDGPVIATSHDRSFINDTATAIYDMDITVWQELAKVDGEPIVGLYRNAGGYSDYLLAKEAARAKHQQIHAAQQAEKRELHEHRRESMKIARGGVRVETAARKEKKFFTDRAAATSVKRTRSVDVRLERLSEREVRKPRHYNLSFPSLEVDPGSGLAVSLRDATVVGRLAPVSFDLGRGEHLLVTGENGAGKSTLLNWIATGNAPEGTAHNGAITRDEPVGVVPQTLPDDSTAGFGTERWQGGVGEAGKGILHPSMWNTPIADLSAGNQRRAQLAVALATQPALLIIDEPTNYLDLETMDALEDALRDWRGTLIIASHDRWLIEHWHGRHLRLTSVRQSAST